MSLLKTGITLFVSLSILQNAYAASLQSEERGLAISREAKFRDLGWGDMRAEMEMILKSQHGEISVRQMKIKSLEQENDGDKSLMVFDFPHDVKGTAFLSFSHPTADDEQWLYLPALKRVKRISSKNKSGSFMGSEFSFEDLTSFEIEKYSYKLIEEALLDDLDCWVIEQYPVNPDSGYKRRVVWIDKSEYRTHKVDFYDRKDALLKTLVMEDYNKYLDKYWRASVMSMENHQSGKSTVLTWKNYKFRTGLSDNDFNKNALNRAR